MENGRWKRQSRSARMLAGQSAEKGRWNRKKSDGANAPSARSKMRSAGAAAGLSGGGDNGFGFGFGQQSLAEEADSGARDTGDVSAVIGPSAARSGAGAGHKLIDAAAVGVHYGACRSIR